MAQLIIVACYMPARLSQAGCIFKTVQSNPTQGILRGQFAPDGGTFMSVIRIVSSDPVDSMHILPSSRHDVLELGPL